MSIEQQKEAIAIAKGLASWFKVKVTISIFGHQIFPERGCEKMAIEQQKEAIATAKGLANWFKVEITISLFGQQIFHWVIPPDKTK